MNIRQNKLYPDSSGFTLIELMIVVAIIGILAAVAIPKFAEMMRKSKEASTKGAAKNMRSALGVYIADNEGVPPGALSDFAPKYIESIPTAKLGAHHPDSDRILSAVGSNRSDFTSDSSGWLHYVNSADFG